MAKRIQRKRTRGWRMPEGAVYVGRPTKWGNPWTLGDGAKTAKEKADVRKKIVRIYKLWMCGAFSEKNVEKIVGNGAKIPKQPLAVFKWLMIRGDLRNNLHELRGKDLACWCPLDQPCHADVLLEIANEGGTNGK